MNSSLILLITALNVDRFNIGTASWMRFHMLALYWYFMIVCSSHKWTGTGSRTSVIWFWSNRTRSGI